MIKTICTFSDTHNKHEVVKLPEADMVIYNGDMTMGGYRSEVENFLQWYSSQSHKYKILIGGNHDIFLDANYYANTELKEGEDPTNIIPDNIIYLNDSMVEIEGIKIWGSPITPYFHGWAFNRYRGDDIIKHWNLIPEDIDILVTHGPPANVGLLDVNMEGQRTGCAALMRTLFRVKPKLHCFGHIHEGYGVNSTYIQDKPEDPDHKITFINAALLNRQYKIANDPVIFDWEEQKVIS